MRDDFLHPNNVLWPFLLPIAVPNACVAIQRAHKFLPRSCLHPNDHSFWQRALQIESNLYYNYYNKTQLYTKTEIDYFLSSGAATGDYISKAPSTVDDVTITPQNINLSVSLLVKSGNNLAATEVQRWENSSTDHLASIFADGKAMFSNYVSIGENVNSDGVALDTNERRIANVADPVNNLDAVNKTYMERFITTTIDDVLTDSDENYLLDALEY